LAGLRPLEFPSRALFAENSRSNGKLHEPVEILRNAMASELGCTSFAIYDVDQRKGVLWPTALSSGDHSRIRPVDMMSHHNLRRAIDGRSCIIYTSAVLIDEFPALVSAFVPLVKNDRSERMVVMFDLRNSFDSSSEQELELLRIVNDLVDRTIGEPVERPCSASVTECAL
jgi:hypothetical protein